LASPAREVRHVRTGPGRARILVGPGRKARGWGVTRGGPFRKRVTSRGPLCNRRYGVGFA